VAVRTGFDDSGITSCSQGFSSRSGLPNKNARALASGDHSDYSKQRPKAMLSFESRRSIPRSRGFGGKVFAVEKLMQKHCDFWYDVGMEKQDPSVPIALHCRVVLELVDVAGEVERKTFTIVPAKQADFRSGLLDENAPLSRALLGHAAGEVILYVVGDLKEVRILSVERADDVVNSDAAERRRAEVRKAEAQSEITNQMIFATASGSKWGDYDVDVDKLMNEDDKSGLEHDVD
jgi:hypothetical protein